MRFLIVLAALALAAVVVVLVLYAVAGAGPSSRARPDEEGARWETHTESGEGVTTVVVRRVARDGSGGRGAEVGRQVVAAIPDGDPEWETRYHEAMAQARSRVAALEIESD